MMVKEYNQLIRWNNMHKEPAKILYLRKKQLNNLM